MQNVKVRLYATENDAYNELWKVVGTKGKFYARHVSGKPVWYHVCDPLGYCELDHPCSDEMVFIICDQAGNPLFKDSNREDMSNPFGTLADKAREEFGQINVMTRPGLQNWLLSYMTPENLAKDPERTRFCPDENWKWCWHNRTDATILRKFTYLGERYCIWELTQRHLYCDCEWKEYVATVEDIDWEWPTYIVHFGENFEPEPGPMYARREAIERVAVALGERFGCKNLSVVLNDSWGNMPYERKFNTREAAEYLVGNDLNRRRVDEIIETGAAKTKFYTSKQAILEDYPDCRLSSRFWY